MDGVDRSIPVGSVLASDVPPLQLTSVSHVVSLEFRIVVKVHELALPGPGVDEVSALPVDAA